MSYIHFELKKSRSQLSLFPLLSILLKANFRLLFAATAVIYRGFLWFCELNLRTNEIVVVPFLDSFDRMESIMWSIKLVVHCSLAFILSAYFSIIFWNYFTSMQSNRERPNQSRLPSPLYIFTIQSIPYNTFTDSQDDSYH